MPKGKPKALKELFAKFFENPSREWLRELLKNHTGEQSDFDFKREWPDFSSIAKHILAIANTGGGCIVFGVAEMLDKTFDAVGLAAIKDKGEFQDQIRSYLPFRLRSSVSLEDFSYDASEYPKIIGKKFQVVFIVSDPTQLPYVSTGEKPGNIRRNAIYIRHQGQTTEASDDDIQQLINTRLSTGYSSKPEIILRNRLEQLKLLHEELAKFQSLPMHEQFALRTNSIGCEKFDDSLRTMIQIQTHRIHSLLSNGS